MIGAPSPSAIVEGPERSPGRRLWGQLLTDGPVTDDPQYFNRMSRSARVCPHDVLEMRSYHDMRVRVGLWLFGLLALVLAGTSGLFFDRTSYPFEDQVEAVRVLTDYHGVPTERHGPQPDARPLDATLASHDEIRSLHRDAAIRELIVSMMFTGPFWLLALVWPRRAPLRLDRRRKVAYSLLKGELVVARIASWDVDGVSPLSTRPAPPPPLTFNADPRIHDGFGPLLTGLMGVRSGRRRIFWMGAQPATGPRQNHELGYIVDCFADDTRDHNRWIHFLRRRRFLPGDILRALDRLSLRRRPDLDDPALQAQLDKAIPDAIRMGDPILTKC